MPEKENVPLDLDRLREAVRDGAAAIRVVTKLEPCGGPGDKVFPPTYEGGKYAWEEPPTDDRKGRNVPLDSVQSQANRLEEALQAAVDAGEVRLPLLRVDFSSIKGDAEKAVREAVPSGCITALEAPHRIADAIFIDSILGGKRFRRRRGEKIEVSPEGDAYEAASTRNATALLRLCPTALIFGVWDSTGEKSAERGNKFARVLSSEIMAVDARPGVRTNSRIDPLGIQANVLLYVAKDGGWTTTESDAIVEKGRPKRYVTTTGKGNPSAINHSNFPPSINDSAGGAVMSHAVQRSVISLAGLRRLRFPAEPGENGAAKADSKASKGKRDAAAQTLLAALALVAITQQQKQGYFLRSRCDLVPAEAADFELVGRTAKDITRLAIGAEEAIELYNAAVVAAEEAGLPWGEWCKTEGYTLTPSQRLVDLIAINAAKVTAGDVDTDDAGAEAK